MFLNGIYYKHLGGAMFLNGIYYKHLGGDFFCLRCISAVGPNSVFKDLYIFIDSTLA